MVEAQANKLNTIQQLAQQLRVDSIRSTTKAGSGHPTSSMSAADLMAVLLTKYLKYDFANPDLPNNDRLVFSKGHASPLLYALLKAAGAISDDELMTLRQFGSRLQGHPVPKILPWVDVATGSLGQGLAMGFGMALAAKYLDRLPYRTWVLLGDSEMAEGSVWEAVEHASHYKLDNLTAILDVNRLGQRGETMLGWDNHTYADRLRAFGWHTIEINGHDFDAIDSAYGEALIVTGQPTCVIAKTIKGKGFPQIENKDGWHGKPLNAEQAAEAVAILGGISNLVIKPRKPENIEVSGAKDTIAKTTGKFDCPTYKSPVATREAYGDALVALGSTLENLVVLDAEVSNSTYAEKFAKAFLQRYFEMYISEQLMVGAATGLSTRGKIVFASTFAAFFSRAYDFIRMASISRADIRLCGSHAGVSIGQDGPSQMALEDLAMMRAVYGSTVLYPCDGTSTVQLVEAMSKTTGISYMRTTREKTSVMYDDNERFSIGGAKVLRSSQKDRATICGAGITVHESLKAYEELKKQGISVRVIDLYSIKPIDEKTLHKAAKETGVIITVEDHWPEGGLGDAVLSAFATGTDSLSSLPRIVKLGVRSMPGSGTPQELLDAAGISSKHIVATVKNLAG